MRHYVNENVPAPKNHTKRNIIVVWPMSWATTISDIDKDNNSHFIHPSVVSGFGALDSTLTQDTFKDLEYAYYEYAKVLADTGAYPETKSIIIDGYPGVIDLLNKDKVHYIMCVPESYDIFSHYAGYCDELSMSKSEFHGMIDTLMNKSFHTIKLNNLSRLFSIEPQEIVAKCKRNNYD